MTFGERTDRGADPYPSTNQRPSMFRKPKEGSTAVAGDDICDFSDVVDKACEGLMNRKIRNSIRRIKEMERRLSCLEQELDEFLSQKDKESV